MPVSSQFIVALVGRLRLTLTVIDGVSEGLKYGLILIDGVTLGLTDELSVTDGEGSVGCSSGLTDILGVIVTLAEIEGVTLGVIDALIDGVTVGVILTLLVTLGVGVTLTGETHSFSCKHS